MLAHNIQRVFPLCHSQLLIDQIRVLSILTDLRQIRHCRIQTFAKNLIPIDYFNKKNDLRSRHIQTFHSHAFPGQPENVFLWVMYQFAPKYGQIVFYKFPVSHTDFIVKVIPRR